MSRVRWAFAGALALVALVATVQTLRTFLAHQMTVGVLAVGALAVTLLVGLGSLGWARRRIQRELAGMRANPPRGELFAARRKRLDAIRAAGARPDREALAQSTGADEAGRAYLGRYLVATTVLMGLVGTFSGLMETLDKIAPLLGEKDASGLALLAAPLAGLHITFGASLVAILATLALALAQGDLALHEELALSLLEDRTTHELIPKLWPPSDDAAERTVRAIDELKTLFAEALGRSLEKSTKRIADNARAEGERAAQALETTAVTVQKEIARLCATVAANAEESARKQSAALAEVAAGVMRELRVELAGAVTRSTEAGTVAVRAAMEVTEASVQKATAAVEQTARRSSEVIEQAARATTAALAGTIEPLFVAEAARLEAVRTALVDAAARIESAAVRLGELNATVEGLSLQHVSSIDRAGQAVVSAFDRVVLGGGAALDGAASTLAAAAHDLSASAETFSPRIATLSTELAALGREVALLAARDPQGELDAVVLGELERLGAGVDRLTELLRLGDLETTRPPVLPDTDEASVAPLEQSTGELVPPRSDQPLDEAP